MNYKKLTMYRFCDGKQIHLGRLANIITGFTTQYKSFFIRQELVGTTIECQIVGTWNLV